MDDDRESDEDFLVEIKNEKKSSEKYLKTDSDDDSYSEYRKRKRRKREKVVERKEKDPKTKEEMKFIKSRIFECGESCWI